MKVYVNEKFEIKDINYTNDNSLTEIVVSEGVLLNYISDFMVHNYCCKPIENGYEIYPSMDYNVLKLLDEQNSKISTLEEENAQITYALMMGGLI